MHMTLITRAARRRGHPVTDEELASVAAKDPDSLTLAGLFETDDHLEAATDCPECQRGPLTLVFKANQATPGPICLEPG